MFAAGCVARVWQHIASQSELQANLSINDINGADYPASEAFSSGSFTARFIETELYLMFVRHVLM